MGASLNLANEGPISLTRSLLQAVRKLGVVSITYHLAKSHKSLRPILPYLHFETGKKFSRYELPDEHSEVLGRCHDWIIENGKPLILSQVLQIFRAAERRLTEEIMAGANNLNVFDQYMIPVYGPFKVNGVISFGKSTTIDPSDTTVLKQMESLAAGHHNRMVLHFGEKRSDIELSKRENEVLTWIARGKSSNDIAIILGLSLSSVDTYTRRIFEKMGVNDRVSAAVNGVVEGLVKPT
ncbi:MAG: LuxR C-terminal-related transcriptional regulator [Erythrobacter sp.]